MVVEIRSDSGFSGWSLLMKLLYTPGLHIVLKDSFPSGSSKCQRTSPYFPASCKYLAFYTLSTNAELTSFLTQYGRSIGLPVLSDLSTDISHSRRTASEGEGEDGIT